MKHTILNVQQAAEYLNRSQDTIRYWIKTSTGPKSFRMGKRRMFLASDLDAWIEAQRETSSSGGGDVA